MSSTNRGGAERRENDFYATPSWCTKAILRHFDRPASILDPCAGEGAILRATWDVFPSAHRHAIEIDVPRAMSLREPGFTEIEVGDALSPETIWPSAEMVLMNPPFNLAFEFVQRAVDGIDRGLHQVAIVLLRMAFVGSAKRSPWLRKNMPEMYVLPKRPSFTGGGTDSADYAWCVWRKGTILGEPGLIRILDLTGLETRASKAKKPAREAVSA